MENSVKAPYTRAARSDLTVRIMLEFSIKALYKWATRSGLTEFLRHFQNGPFSTPFYSFVAGWKIMEN